MDSRAWSFFGVISFLIGLTSIIGWIFHVPYLIQYDPDIAPIPFNSSVCILLISTAYLCLAFYNEETRRLQMLLAGIVLVIATLTLYQDIFHVNLRIDELFMKFWLPGSATKNPARIAPNAAIGFMLSSFIIIFYSFAEKKLIGIMIDICIFLIFLISLLGLSGYITQLEFLYGWYSYTRIAFPTAIAFLSLSIAFWGTWRSSEEAKTLYRGKEDTKIILVSSAILLCLGLAITIANFISLIRQQNLEIENTFSTMIQNENRIFNGELQNGRIQLENLLNDDVVAQAFSHLKDKNINAANVFPPSIKKILSHGFSAVTIYDVDNKKLISAGKFAGKPEMTTLLPIPNGITNLVWAKAWYQIIAKDIIVGNKKMGTLVVEWPMRNMNFALSQNSLIGESGDMLVCQQYAKTEQKCFSARSQSVYIIPKQKSNQDLPIRYALQGKTGILYVYDYQYQRVIVAYGPFNKTGLGLIIHMALTELYSPITKSLYTILPIILIVIIIGLILLRLQVIPLIRRVINAEKDLLRTNKRLKESEERYVLAVRGSNIGLWDWDVEKDYVFYSPYMKGMLGYTETEFANTRDAFTKILHPDDNDRVFALLEEHFKNHVPFDIEYRLRRKTGDYHWFHAVGQALWDEEGNPIRMAGSITDVTDRKKAEQRLSAQFAITKLLADAQTLEDVAVKIVQSLADKLEWEFGAIWMIDYLEGVIHPLACWSNPSLDSEELCDVTMKLKFKVGEGLPGRVWDSGQPLWVFDMRSDKKIVRYELFKKFNLNSALSFPILLHNRVLGVLEFFSKERRTPDEAILKMMAAIGAQVGQFVQRRAAEKALRESESYKTAILESGSDSIMTLSPEGEILSLNSRTLEIFGYNEQELLTKNINLLIPNISKKLKNLESKLAGDLVAITKDSKKISIELMISKMTVNERAFLVCVIRDINERNRITKLKDEFVSVVSHELQTPLTSIRESLRLILSDAVGSIAPQAKKLLEIVQKNCDHLLLILSEILDIEKIEVGRMNYILKVINVDDLISPLIKRLKSTASRLQIKLSYLKTQEFKIKVDEERLTEVLNIFLKNAFNASSAKDEIEVRVLAKDKMVRIEVADQRESLPEDFHKHIFEKRPTLIPTDISDDASTGLSLSLCKAIIESFKGNIGFYTEAEKTIYYFELPIWQEENEANVSSRSGKTAGALLICEDDEKQALFLTHMLGEAGFDADIVYTAKNAKKLLAAKEYNALLLDLIMPDQDGIALIRELRSREETRTLPIIILSVTAQKGKSLIQGDAISVVDWFDKPVDFNKLMHAVGLLQKQLHKESITLLHIEDDPNTRRIISAVLQDHASITEIDNLAKARKILVKQHFDLVILDLLLPDGNGAELLPILAKLRIPVIVFSAAEQDHEFGKTVKQALIKSETSSEYLINTIKTIVESGE